MEEQVKEQPAMSKKELDELRKERAKQEKAYQEQQLIMKQQVADTELKARYWKAQFEVMDYSLKYAAMEDQYTEHLKQQQEKLQQAFQQVQENVEKVDGKVEETTKYDNTNSVHSGGFQGGV